MMVIYFKQHVSVSICRWRFVFYLIAFTAGLAFLIDVRCQIDLYFFSLGNLISYIKVYDATMLHCFFSTATAPVHAILWEGK